jgi:tRNA U55 pseudouridine synthase TruB
MNGRPLYALARTGQTVERQPRPIVVHDAAVLAILCRRKRNRAAPAWPAICG